MFAIALLSSCASSKSITYFQSQNTDDAKYQATLLASDPIPLRIQSNDMLAIVVSSLSEESNALFNVLNASAVTIPRFSSGGGGGSQPIGYLVDASGEVSMPLLGKVKLAGLTLEEASEFTKNQLSRYIKEPTANVRILNHKFTVIGEVARPGIYNLDDNSTSLPEVIGMAGDLTVFGRRNNVMLIRTVNNKREVIKLDLTSRKILNSPYYFIENNDVVYVEPNSGKITSTDRTLQLLPVVVSILTTTLLVVRFF